MDLERLEEFVTIAQLGSLKKAASQLGLSTATLSARLLRFEERMGGPLFLRAGGTMELTSSGRQLLPNALDILARYRDIRQDMQRAQEHSYRKLRIAVTGTSLPLHLGPFLDQINLKYPHIQLELLDDSRWSVVDGLNSGAVDIYFAPAVEGPVPKNLVRQVVGTPGEFLFLPKAHRLADRSMVSLRELDGESFILYPQTAETAIRDFQLRNLRDSGIRCTLYESDTAVLFTKLLVPIGKGLLLYPHMMDAPPNTACLPVTDLPHHASVCFFYHKIKAGPDVLAFVKDYLAFIKEVTRYEHRQTL